MFPSLRYLFFAVIGVSLLASPASAGDGKFVELFNGKDLAGWKIFPEKADKAFTVSDDYIKVKGNPAGYFYTEKSYKNYILKFDWRFKRPENLEDEKKFGGNSGLLVHITGPHKVWPNSLEVQGANSSHGSFISIGKTGLSDGKYSQATVHKVRNKVGEWNTTEVTINHGDVVVKVNGTQVNSGKFTLPEGPFGFQSEGSELHFKNIKIKVLSDGADPGTEKKKETKTVIPEEKKIPKTETPPEKKKEPKIVIPEEKKIPNTETPKTKVETIPSPAATLPQATPQPEVYLPQRRGLFPNLRARLRGR